MRLSIICCCIGKFLDNLKGLGKHLKYKLSLSNFVHYSFKYLIIQETFFYNYVLRGCCTWCP